MAFVEDLTPYFADFGEDVTVNSVAARGIFNKAAELVLNDVLTQGITLELPATVAASAGQTCLVRDTSYVIRQVIDLPPDGAIRQLVLSRP